jgi:phi13 family phage major tail protein
MKVVFNIKKLQFSKISSVSAAGVPTYETPILVPGTVSLSMETESTTDPFYADGIAYYMPSGATSTTGTLENAWISEEALKAIYGYVEDANGNLIETDAAPSEFGMQFACDSDEGEVYFTYYRVGSNKPGLNVQTSESSATINPQSVEISASTVNLASGQRILKSYAKPGASNYNTYFQAIVLPTIQ